MSDFDPPDYLNVVPFDGCSDELDTSPLPRPKFELQSCAQFAVTSPAGWLIKGVIPKAELVVIYGAPGSGKTFAALHMLMSIARGLDEWGGRKIKQGKVVYVAAEAPNGLKNRIIAYAKYSGIDLEDLTDFWIIPDAPNLLTPEDAKLLASQIVEASVICIDTLARTMPGGDENGSLHMGQVIANAQLLHKLTGSTIILIHHCGKNQENGSRGWSGLLGAVDTEIKIEDTKEAHSLTITKQKEGDLPKPWGFSLNQLVIGQDEDGDDVTSCYFELSDYIPVKKEKKPEIGGVQAIVLKTLSSISEKFITVEDLTVAVAAKLTRGDGLKDERRKRAKNAIDRLSAMGTINLDNDIVFKTSHVPFA